MKLFNTAIQRMLRLKLKIGLPREDAHHITED